MIGPVAVEYAIELGDVDPYRLADDVTGPAGPHRVVRRGLAPRPRLRADRAGRRGVRRPAPGRSHRGSGVQSATAPRPRSRSPGDPVGWSTYGDGRSPPSKGTSTSGPTGSPPSVSTGSEPTGPAVVPRTTCSPRSRSSSRLTKDTRRGAPSACSSDGRRRARSRHATASTSGPGRCPSRSGVGAPRRRIPAAAFILERGTESSETSTVPGLATPTSRLARLTTGP